MRTKRVKGLIIASLTMILMTRPSAVAVVFDESLPPAWRGLEGTTTQQWSFSDPPPPLLPTGATLMPPDMPPMLPDAGYSNSYGVPLLQVDTDFPWIDVVDTRQGVWPLSGEIDIYIPNWQELRPEKEIWIQLTWQGASNDPFMPEQPLVGVVSNPWVNSMQISREDTALTDGWTLSVFKVNMWPNPYEEWIAIKGDIMVDRVVVDTYCIPEPATLALFAIGGLAALRRKRRRN